MSCIVYDLCFRYYCWLLFWLSDWCLNDLVLCVDLCCGCIVLYFVVLWF